MRNKLLFFLGIFIFIMIPNNVFAKEFIPWYAKVNSTEYAADFTTTGNIVVGNNINANGGYTDYGITVELMDYTNTPGTYPDFSDYPFVWIFFETIIGQYDMTITLQGGCTNSCFNDNNIVLKHIGYNPSNSRQRYVLILPTKKIKIEWGTMQTIYKVEQNVRIQNNSSTRRWLTITDVLVSDSANVQQVADYSTIISGANTNATNIINSANQNTQNIINNNNTNTQNIINNQNQNANQAHQDSQAINNSLNDDSGVANNDVSSKATEWASKNASTTPISSMVLMPITLLNAYTSGMSASCTPYNLGSFYGTDIILPCINISNYLGSTLWGVIDVLVSGLMIYAIGKKFVKIFNDFTNLRDNQVDELYGGGN